jgi:membrane-bound inhibitor of C-type lysozyme
MNIKYFIVIIFLLVACNSKVNRLGDATGHLDTGAKITKTVSFECGKYLVEISDEHLDEAYIIYKHLVITLSNVVSASGVLYENNIDNVDYAFFTKGKNAFLKINKKHIDCVIK